MYDLACFYTPEQLLMTDTPRIWQVSELNHAARNLLETRFGIVTVSGEISVSYTHLTLPTNREV